LKREFCDRCSLEQNYLHTITLPTLKPSMWRGDDYYDLCKDCVEIIRKVLKKECSIIVGEVSNR